MRRFLNHNEKYKKIVTKLGLIENEEAIKILSYISELYPEPTDESCKKLVRMLDISFPEKE
jgi:hypothetical protein